MTTILKPTALELNALADLEEIARDLNGEFCIPDREMFAEEGIDFHRAVLAVVKNDEAVRRNNFVRRMHNLTVKGGSMTKRQVVTLANIVREQVLGLKPNKGYLTDLGLDLAYAGRFKCKDCDAVFEHRKDWLEHKRDSHGWEPGHGTLDQAILNPISVLDQDEETGLNIGALHDGFYAVFDKRLRGNPSGFVRYLRVTRTRRESEHVNKGFVWGKVVKGSEVLPVQTIKVRDVSGDTKRLCGYQRPDETYRGEFTDLLEMILTDQLASAELYARLRKKCMICGKGLTDDTSCIDLIGPECIKKYQGLRYYDMDPLAHFTPLADKRSEVQTSAVPKSGGVVID